MRSGLPQERSSFVGRRSELVEVKRLLTQNRLLTLTGTGGVGKTRLALRAAADLNRAFRDGVRLVELAGLADDGLLADAVASALGLRDTSARWALGALAEHVGDRELLLVLDNCEHLVDAVAVLADSLLKSCGRLRLLATSRQPLDVVGETTLRVPSLSLPGPAADPTGLLDYEATRLFLERAREAVPGFSPSDEERQPIARICVRLDGIPLAIELAAVRLRTLTPELILARLDDRFELLATRASARSSRHHTLRAAIEWSEALLEPGERELWRRLAVFSSGFDVEAAAAVAADGGEAGALIGPLTGLVEKSIVGFGGAAGRGRYRLAETLREYGRRRLQEAGEEAEYRSRHRDWYLGLGRLADGAWLTGANVGWLDRFDSELDNVRAAFAFCLETPGEAGAGLELASSLWMYWTARGQVREGRRWLTALLAADRRPTAVRAAALMTAGVLCRVQGEVAAAFEHLSEARAVAEAVGDGWRAGLVLAELAVVAAERGSTREALALLEDMVGRVRAPGDRLHRSYVEYMANVLVASHQHELAVPMLEEALALCREAEDRWRECWAQRALATTQWRRGDHDAARRHLRQSLLVARELGDLRAIAGCLETLSWVEADRGRIDRSALLLAAAGAVWESVGVPLPASWRDDHERAQSAVNARMSEPGIRGAADRGRSVPVPEAIALALEEPAAPAPIRQRASRPSALSVRESEVAALVAGGATNKEVAARLFLSVRTVDTHVDNILRKLGLNSRVQLALWWAETAGSEELRPAGSVSAT